MQDLKITEKLEVWLHYHYAYASAKQLAKVKKVFGSLQQGIDVTESQWLQSKILKPKQLSLFFDTNKIQKLVAQAVKWSQQPAQYIITLDDINYPYLLKNISDPPIILYIRGNLNLLSEPQLAVVGSRNASKSGIAITENFSSYISQQGLAITSGLASGIDSAAHRGGLAQVGQTIAVMGTGIDRIYPASNKLLAHKILDKGTIVSEYPLETRPLPQNFPRRNRIISGLSYGVLVVEAALKSGSLITARMAMEQGREVFALPGSINNPQVKGCHQLIKQGAKLVETGQEILEELLPLITVDLQTTNKVMTNPPENLDMINVQASDNSGLLKYIEYEPISLDELVVLCKMPVYSIQTQLLQLELDSKIEALSAGRYRRL